VFTPFNLLFGALNPLATPFNPRGIFVNTLRRSECRSGPGRHRFDGVARFRRLGVKIPAKMELKAMNHALREFFVCDNAW
jgi:hypothetical protein